MCFPSITPAAVVVLLWRPKSKRYIEKYFIEQVQRTQELTQSLDEEQLGSTDAAAAKSYVSIDNITVSAYVTWKTNGDKILIAMRNVGIPKTDSTYINKRFG